MATMKSSRTETNLHRAFATETLVSRRYQAFAEQAEAEGNHAAAALFREIADRRCSHARRHLELLEPTGGTVESQSGRDTAYNMRAAIMDEVHEAADRYPAMVRQARHEGFEDIAEWFECLARASRSHAGRFRRARETLM